MSSDSRILFIVEGDLEYKIATRIAAVYELNCKIAVVRTNIHSLYRELRDDGFLNVISVLKEHFQKTINTLQSGVSNPNQGRQLRAAQDDLSKLDEKYAYRYLFFDTEIQHSGNRSSTESGSDIPRQQLIMENYHTLKNMVEYFDDETDQGKLFINYPMMESYRDCDDYFDDNYKDRMVSLDDLFARKYKELVGRRGLSNIRVNQITKHQFDQLIRMNVFKLNSISTEKWCRMDYQDFLKYSKQQSILDVEQNLMTSQHMLAVLNTLLYLPLDYFGQKIYSEIVK